MALKLRFDDEDPLVLDDVDGYLIALHTLYQAARVNLSGARGALVTDALAQALESIGLAPAADSSAAGGASRREAD